MNSEQEEQKKKKNKNDAKLPSSSSHPENGEETAIGGSLTFLRNNNS